MQPNIAAVYNLNTNTYVYLPMTDSPFCGAHLQLIDDRILVVGGDNIGLTPTFTDGRQVPDLHRGTAMSACKERSLQVFCSSNAHCPAHCSPL